MFRMIQKSSSLFLLALVAALVMAGCGGSSSGSSQPVDVQVNLSEFAITSSLTTFKVGVPYHFTVKNSGAAPHEFQIMPPATGQLTQDQINQMSLAGIGSADLGPGASKTLDYTFTKEYPQGSLEFACHLPGHYEAGMKVPIVVTK